MSDTLLRYGGRGSWLLENKSTNSKLSTLQVMNALTDEESPYARANQPLPASRTGVYSAHVNLKVHSINSVLSSSFSKLFAPVP
jgi:hypothetical protein